MITMISYDIILIVYFLSIWYIYILLLYFVEKNKVSGWRYTLMCDQIRIVKVTLFFSEIIIELIPICISLQTLQFLASSAVEGRKDGGKIWRVE